MVKQVQFSEKIHLQAKEKNQSRIINCNSVGTVQLVELAEPEGLLNSIPLYIYVLLTHLSAYYWLQPEIKHWA